PGNVPCVGSRSPIKIALAGGHQMVDDTPDHVLATYREIAERFGLGTVRAARTKVKRARWTHDPPNHPSDPLHIRVPRGPWQQAGTTAPDRPDDALGSKARDPGHRSDDARPDQSRDAAGIKGRDPGQQR